MCIHRFLLKFYGGSAGRSGMLSSVSALIYLIFKAGEEALVVAAVLAAVEQLTFS